MTPKQFFKRSDFSCNYSSRTKLARYNYFPRHRRGHGKGAAVELTDMAGSDSVDSKEELKADTSVNNVCYVKIPSKQGSGKNAAVESDNMVGKRSTDSIVEQDMATSVDNTCYDTLPSKFN